MLSIEAPVLENASARVSADKILKCLQMFPTLHCEKVFSPTFDTASMMKTEFELQEVVVAGQQLSVKVHPEAQSCYMQVKSETLGPEMTGNNDTYDGTKVMTNFMRHHLPFRKRSGRNTSSRYDIPRLTRRLGVAQLSKPRDAWKSDDISPKALSSILESEWLTNFSPCWTSAHQMP